MTIFRSSAKASESEPQYGIKVLYDSNEAEVDIVFVHGLGGSRDATWTIDDVCWPQALLPQDLPKTRIMTFGYDSRVVSFTSALSQNGIVGNAEDLCAQLSRFRASSVRSNTTSSEYRH
ncbi:SesB [Aspergillus luchuensis]|uniref:SesB n=1 Tax=Aspergillus kawachii TaxID=1069201 RepID=A0A146F4V9_ASPKA|nr:SesB [Aspergillus luchuensis]